MDDSDCDLDSKIKMLNEKVSEITRTNVKSDNGNNQSAFLTINVIKSPVVYYGIIPVFIMLLLFFLKPSFIMEKISIDGKLPEKKLSYKKLIIATIIVTAIICIVVFIYLYKNTK
jgi:hypothetical protein